MAKTRLHPLPKRLHFALLGVAALCAFWLFVHADAIETANHSYLLLESTFSGNFRSFYGIVAEHQNDFYYLNNAHYNIVVYLIYAVAELPAYIICSLAQISPAQAVLTFIGKAVCAAFFVGCLPLLYRIAHQLGLSKDDAAWAPLLFALSFPAFFSAMVMGQYDVICLFFLLCGLLAWLQRRMVAFSLWFGIAIAVKIFPAFLFLPLLLLREKRLLRIAGQGILALWLWLPTSLLFYGLTFSMANFNAIMVERLFAARLAGAREIPLFATLYILLCIVCYCWRPPAEKEGQAGIYLGLASFGLLFLFVEWHPQWLVLLVPFMVLSTLLEENRLPWLFVDMLFAVGFVLVCVFSAPGGLEANLFDWGAAGLMSGHIASTSPAFAPLAGIYATLPVIGSLPMVLFSSSVLCHLALKLPLSKGTPASRFAHGSFAAMQLPKQMPLYAWLVFATGLCVWFLPVLASWLYTLLA